MSYDNTTRNEKEKSRQWQWQERTRAAGGCVICAKPRVNKNHCRQHADAAAARVRAAKRLRRKRGLCAHIGCNDRTDGKRQYCKAHMEYQRQWQRNKRSLANPL